jgi:hypothetical protein
VHSDCVGAFADTRACADADSSDATSAMTATSTTPAALPPLDTSSSSRQLTTERLFH